MRTAIVGTTWPQFVHVCRNRANELVRSGIWSKVKTGKVWLDFSFKSMTCSHRAQRWCIAVTENPIKWLSAFFVLSGNLHRAEKCHRLVRVGADKWKSIVVVNMGQVVAAATNQRPWSVWTTKKCVYREKSRIDLWWIVNDYYGRLKIEIDIKSQEQWQTKAKEGFLWFQNAT